MRYLHSMVRVRNLEEAIDFYCGKLGLQEVYRYDNEKGRFTNVFLKAPSDQVGEPPKERKMGMSTYVAPVLELTYNWDPKEYTVGRGFGHLAYGVENIYEFCEKLMKQGVIINRPPRDGKLAFIKSPDGISIELLQMGEPLTPAEPWKSMENSGTW